MTNMRDRFLCPVRVMGALFRGNFLHAPRRLHHQGKRVLDDHDAPRFERILDSLVHKR